jgi:hypothetical protein
MSLCYPPSYHYKRKPTHPQRSLTPALHFSCLDYLPVINTPDFQTVGAETPHCHHQAPVLVGEMLELLELVLELMSVLLLGALSPQVIKLSGQGSEELAATNEELVVDDTTKELLVVVSSQGVVIPLTPLTVSLLVSMPVLVTLEGEESWVVEVSVIVLVMYAVTVVVS